MNDPNDPNDPSQPGDPNQPAGPHRPSLLGRSEQHNATMRRARELRVRMLVRVGDPNPPPAALLHQIAHEIHRRCGYNLIKSHRLAWNLTIEQAVAAVHRMCVAQGLGARGLADRSWKHWESGEHPSTDYQDLLGRLFQTSPVGLGFAHDYTDYPRRLDGVTNTPVPAGGVPDHPNDPSYPAGDPRLGLANVERRLIVAADESARLGDHLSTVGPLTLDGVRTDARTLAGRFATAPRIPLFESAVHLRDRIFTLLDGRQRVAETRELYFLAAASLGMLAEATQNLGYRHQAMTHLRTALICANEADHPDLTAWLLGVQSMVSFWDGRPAKARDHARQGRELNATGTAAVWLAANEARAVAALGDEAGATAALERAAGAREAVRPDVLDAEYGGIMTFLPAKEQYFASGTWIALSDGLRTRQAAEAAIQSYQDGPPEARARDNEAVAHVNVALAHVVDGDLDAADSALGSALLLPPELSNRSFTDQLRHLHARVSVSRYRGSAQATALRDRIETHLAAPTPALPPG
ncbi:MAG TPA: hypothetical protein VFX70_05395 [Mycobacteriales bacterium]|nr:hypothetical protein [Mycobacteriales bacterium]